MCSVKLLALAGAAMIVGISSASAADLPPVYQKAPPIVEEVGGGWYLRGDIGFSNQSVSSISNVNDPASVLTVDKGFDAAPLFVFGAGYQFNPWLRADVTGEYRGSANFHALQSFVFNGGTFPDSYSASKTEWVALANVFADLGTWWCVTPFVGAGVGVADVTVSHFQDVAAFSPNSAGSQGFAKSASSLNLAWALYAGLAYKVTPGLSLELAYRYIDLGDAKTGNLTSIDGLQTLGPEHFNHITSQDIMLGVRWNFAPIPAPEPYMPLMRKG